MSGHFKEAVALARNSLCAGLAFATVVGCALYAVSMHSVEAQSAERFEHNARVAQSRIVMRIKSYTDVLRAAGSQLRSVEAVEHGPFHDFVVGLDLATQYPAIDVLNWAPYVLQADRAAFERKLGGDVPQLRHLATGPATARSPVRPDYLPVAYIEPHYPRRDRYGIDLQQLPGSGDQLGRARLSGRMHSSGSPIPVLSGPNDMHLGIRLPLYKRAMPLTSDEERRAAFLGSVGLSFSVPRLLQGVLDELPVHGVRLIVRDHGPAMDADGRWREEDNWTVYDSAGTRERPYPPPVAGSQFFTTSLPLDFNGRVWNSIYTVPRANLLTGFDRAMPVIMLAVGFIGGSLAYAFLYVVLASRRAALALAHDMTGELRASQDRLQASHATLRQLADHAYQIKELERKRIAREIHDDLGQSLLVLRIDADVLMNRTKLGHRRLHERARAALAQIDTFIRSMRQIINDLRPTVLDLGLSAAVEWQCNQFQRRTGIPCDLLDSHDDMQLSDEAATALFRILQESLSNIGRHADASEVLVTLTLVDGWLTLTVRDNGCGMATDSRSKAGSFGLVGIEERMVILGGAFNVTSVPGGGTRITVSVPGAVRQQEAAMRRAVGHASSTVL